MSEDRMREALENFDKALQPLVTDAVERGVFVEAVWKLMEVLLDRVTLIAHRGDKPHTEEP